MFQLVWLGLECYVDTPDGNRHSLMPPFPKKSEILKDGGDLKVECVERIAKYKLNDVVTFSPNDLGEICLLFQCATDDIAKSAFEYLKRMGIAIEVIGKQVEHVAEPYGGEIPTSD